MLLVGSRHASLAVRIAFFSAVAVGCLLLISAADAQELKGRTVVYTFAGESGQIYVAPSGNIYYSFKNRRVGLQFKLGRTVQRTQHGCRAQYTAALNGSVLLLDDATDCPSRQQRWTQHMVVRMNGNACQLSNRMTGDTPGVGHTDTAFTAESCVVLPGNHLAQ